MIKNHSRVAAAVAAGACALGLAVPPAFAEDTAPLPTPSTSTTKPAEQSSETAPGTKPSDPLPAPTTAPTTTPIPKPQDTTPTETAPTPAPVPTTKPSQPSVTTPEPTQSVTDDVTVPAPGTASTTVGKAPSASLPVRRSYTSVRSRYRYATRSGAASAPRLAQTGASIVPLAVVSAGLMVLDGVSFIARRTFDR